MVQLLWKTVWQFLEKLKIELPYELAISLLSIYTPKELKAETGSSRRDSAETNLTINHEDVGLIPDLSEWVKDPVFLWAVV